MLKKLVTKMRKTKLEKYNQASYQHLTSTAITPAEEIEIRAIFTRAQR